MAIRGQKRASSHGVSEAANNKKRCMRLAKVLEAGAGGYPGALMSDLATKALLTYKADRHALQTQAIEMVSEALKAAQKSREQDLAQKQAKVAEAPQEKVARAKQLEAEKAKVGSLTEQVAAKKVEAKQASDAVEAANTALATAKKTQKTEDKVFVDATAQQTTVNDMAFTASGGALDKKLSAKALRMAKDLGCDKALLDALAGTLKQSAESRSSFGQSTIQQFVDVLTAKSNEYAGILSAGAPGRAERAAVVVKAEEDRSKAIEHEKNTDKALQDLQGALAEAKKTAKAAEHKVSGYFADMKVLMDGMDKAKEELKEFKAGPVDDFAHLKELVPPPEPVEPEPVAPVEPVADTAE